MSVFIPVMVMVFIGFLVAGLVLQVREIAGKPAQVRRVNPNGCYPKASPWQERQ